MPRRVQSRPVYVKLTTIRTTLGLTPTTSTASTGSTAELEGRLTKLTARLTYAEGYLKMIDEAIAIEGFAGWAPPSRV